MLIKNMKSDKNLSVFHLIKKRKEKTYAFQSMTYICVYFLFSSIFLFLHFFYPACMSLRFSVIINSGQQKIPFILF